MGAAWGSWFVGARIAAAAVAIAVLAPTPAIAHDYWLAPTTHTLDRDGEVGVSILVGEKLVHEEDRPMELDRTPRIELAHGDAVLDLRERQAELAVPALRVPLAGAGRHLLLVDRVPAFVELAPAKFETYLRAEGLDRIIGERAARGESALPGREQYRRNLKALFQVGTARDQTFARIVGQTLELVAETDPAAAAPGTRVAFRLLFRGTPLANHRIEALSRGLGGGVSVVRSATTTTDADGRASFAIDRNGAWLVRAVHMTRCEADCLEGAAWDSFWTAYTFANPASSDHASSARSRLLLPIGASGAAVLIAAAAWSRRRRVKR